MKGLQTDTQLVEIVAAPAPTTTGEVTALIERIDQLLLNSDGLKWFNRLYLMVTNEVNDHPPPGGWRDAAWISSLDVTFALLYFQAISKILSGLAAPRSWQALFEARSRAGVDRIQFALAGMNAHINHDLSLALLQTNQQLNVTPTMSSPQHDDFEHVNDLLAAVLPSALQTLATGILGELAQDTGKIGRFLAIWDIRAARDFAWGFSDHLRTLNGLAREVAVAAQDQATGMTGRLLLLPV